MTVSVFFSRGTGRISNIIARVSAPRNGSLMHVPSHAGLLFGFGNAADPLIWEAHIKTGWHRLSWEAILDELRVDPKRKLWVVDLPFSEAEAEHVYQRARCAMWDYARGQLGTIYLWRRLHIPVLNSPHKVVCSEAVSRCLYSVADGFNPLTIARTRNHDSVTPWNLFSGFSRCGYKPREIVPEEDGPAS